MHYYFDSFPTYHQFNLEHIVEDLGAIKKTEDFLAICM